MRVGVLVRGAFLVGALAGDFVLGFFVAGLAVFCGVGAGIGIFMPGIPGIVCFVVSCWALARAGATPARRSAASVAERMVSTIARARRFAAWFDM